MHTASHRLYCLGGTTELDSARRLVRSGGHESSPRPRTFDLLLYLVDHRERVVPLRELKETLWPDVSVTDNSVTQCVNEARKVLGDDSREQRFIRTVPKVGYQFVAPVVVEESTAAAPISEPGISQPAPRRRFLPALLAIAVALTAAGLIYQSRPVEPPWWEAAWWKLDEGSGSRVADATRGLSGEVPLGVAWRAGVSGSALGFPGGEIAVQGRDRGGALPKGSAARTLFASVRAKAGTGADAVIFQYGNLDPESPSPHFFIAKHDGGAALFGNRNVAVGRRPIDDGAWHQVAGVFEGGENGKMRLYVDGREEASAVAAGPWGSGGDEHWSIGRGLTTGTSLRGEIDDVRVFARALRQSELMALSRCQSGTSDVVVNGGRYWFSPVFGDEVEWGQGGEQESSSRLRNLGQDYSGISFARDEPGCPLGKLRGASLGDNLRIEGDFRFGDTSGQVTEAGPWFRSRKPNPGDGLFGGVSAGYWVQLLSTGQVRVMRLRPMAAIALSEGRKGFDPSVFHRLTAEAKGPSLVVTLDGSVVTFDMGAIRTATVPLDAKWETLAPPGQNGGAAGIAFGASRNRGLAGGQEARNIRVVPARDLLP